MVLAFSSWADLHSALSLVRNPQRILKQQRQNNGNFDTQIRLNRLWRIRTHVSDDSTQHDGSLPSLSIPEDVTLPRLLSSSEISMTPIFRLGSGKKEKVVTTFGLWVLFVSLITLPIWWVLLKIEDVIYMINKGIDPTRSMYDATGKAWCKIWLGLTLSYPKVTGELETLQDQYARNGKSVLFVANHASWLDIPILCTALDIVFKFIAKGELGKLPCIGDQLLGVRCWLRFTLI